jgi:hypothetical protein
MLGLGLGLNVNKQLQGFETLVKSAGGVLYYDARKDLIQANGVTPDRSGKGNDVTWANFAGTGASGLVIENGKVFRRLDGTDDFGSMVNTSSIDITNAPLAVFVTKRLSASAATSFLFCKNLDNTTNEQYGMLWDATNKYIRVDAENVNRCNSGVNSVLPDTWYNEGFIWDGTNINIYINKIPTGIVGAYSGALTSRPNIRVGARSNSVDGSTTIGKLKGDLATLTIYAGAKATEANILKAEKALSKAYI